MSSRKTKKNQRLGSSRRYKNRNRDTEENENEEGFPDPENEDHGSEQSQIDSVPKSQGSNESSVLQSDQQVIACTNPNTSDLEQSLHPQSQDLVAQVEVTSKKRKMGSTRKSRNITFEGIHEDEPEHMAQISEGVSNEQVMSTGASIKEDWRQDDQKSLSDCAGNQSSEPESSILQKKHLEIIQNEEDQHSEKGLQNNPIDISSSERNQSIKTEFGQNLLHTSLDFGIIPPTECSVPLQESDESLQTCHQMDTFSELVASGHTTMINPPVNENREESLNVQTSLKGLLHNDEPSMTEYTVLETIEDRSSVDFIIIEKPEDKQEREDVDIPRDCSAEDIGQNEVPEIQPASVIKEYELGTQDDKASKEDENVVDLEHMDDILKLTTESSDKCKSTEFREDLDDNKEVSVAGDRTENNLVEWGVATNLNQLMEPDRSIISPLKLRDQDEVLDQLFSSEFKFQTDSEVKSYKEEHYDFSKARSWIRESSSDENIAILHYDKEEKHRALGREKGVENDDRQYIASNQPLFLKVSSTNMLPFVLESDETQFGETETSSQTCNLSHNNPGEFPSELELQSKEVCSDEMLEKVIKDRSEFLDLETEGVVEDGNNDIKEEKNAGSSVHFTKGDFISVDDETNGVATFMNKHEMTSVVTNIQDYAFADEASMVVEELDIKSLDKESISPVHTHPASDTMECNPETQFKLDLLAYNRIAVPDQIQNMSEECLVNPTNRESEAEQFKSKFLIEHESRLGQDNAGAEDLSFCHSEKNNIETHRNPSVPISEGEQKETMQVQSLQEMTCVSENGTFSFTPKISSDPLSPMSLNIMGPEQINENVTEIDENVINAVVKNENTNSLQECYEAPQHTSSEFVSTNQVCGVLDRQDEETVMIKYICHRVDTTVVMLSDDDEHFDTEDFKMQSRKERAESIIQNQEATGDGDKDDQRMSIEESKSSECDEHVNITVNIEHSTPSIMGTSEAAQLPEANNMQSATTTPIEEEDHVLMSTYRHRKEIRSICRAEKREGKDNEKISNAGGLNDSTQQQKKLIVDEEKYAESMLLAVKKHGEGIPDEQASSTCGPVEFISGTQAVSDMEINQENEVVSDQNRNKHKEHLQNANEGKKETEQCENTNPFIKVQESKSLQVDVIQKNLEISSVEERSRKTGLTRKSLRAQIPCTELKNKASEGQENTQEQNKEQNVTITGVIEEERNDPKEERNSGHIVNLSKEEQEMAPVYSPIQNDAFIQDMFQKARKNYDESPGHEYASSTCGPVELIPDLQAMSDMQMTTENITAVVSDRNQNKSKDQLENPSNRESVDMMIENLKLSTLEKKKKIGSTQKSLRGQITGSDQKNKSEAINEQENIQDQNTDQNVTSTVVIEEKSNDSMEEINAGHTENFTKEDITAVCSQEYTLCELSSQTTDLSLTTIEHPSPATEHPEVMEGEGDSVENVENRTTEIHSQTQSKKKKKFGSTRRPHGGEKREWKDAEFTEEAEHQIIIQDSTSHLLTESQNPVSEVSLHINDSLVTPEEIIQSENEIMTERIDAPPALFNEGDQIHTEVSNEISDAEGLTDIIEPEEKLLVKDAESVALNEQELEPIISPKQNSTFRENVFLAVEKHGDESLDDENNSSTCGPVELIPEMQAMSDMQLTKDDITAVVSNKSQNKCEEHLENPTNSESEPEQFLSTSPFVQIQESSSPQVDVTQDNLEFSSLEKNRKIGSTRKRLRGQITGSDQKNKSEAINEQENIQDQNTDQNVTSTVVIEEKSNDSMEEINAGHTVNFTKEDITAVCSQEYTLCELSSQTTDLSLTTIEHPSPATEHPEVMEDEGDSVENVENRTAEIHSQTQSKKKKKFGSTRRPHGGEKREWKDAAITEEAEHQIITQDSTSHMLTESQNPVTEVSLDINDSLMTPDQQEKTQTEKEFMTERIDAPPALFNEADQIHTEVSNEISNAGGLTDIIEQDEKMVVNEVKDAESIVLNEQEMTSVFSPIQNDALIQDMFQASSTCSPVELIPETQAMSDIQLTTDDSTVVVSDRNRNKCEDQLENPTNRESGPDQLVITSPFVQIQESKSPQVDVMRENLKLSGSEKKRKIGSTRKSLRGQITGSDQKNKSEVINEQENIQDQNTDQNVTSTGVIEEKSNDSMEEINAGHTVNFTKEDITAVCSQEYTLCELSSQTIDLSLTTIEHPSLATEHPEVMEDEGDSVENVENRTEEIHSQTQRKKKKKFGSTRRPHGGEKTEWKDAEITEETEHQIIIQDSTSHMLTESQNPVSEVSLDINDSLMTPEEIIQSENEIMTERIDAPPALFNEGDQIHTEVSNEISDAEGLTDIIEPEEKLLVKDAESVALNEQGLEPIISPIQNSTLRENVFLAVEKHGDESVDDENTSSTCGPVELIPEMQAMSDMQLTKDDITAVVSNKSQNKCEEHLENSTNSESEPEQFLSTSPFVHIQESSSPQVDVTQDNLEFSSLEKKRKIGSTRKRLRGQITGSDQKNKSEAINEQENIQDQNTDQNVTSTVVIEEKSNDSMEEINAGHTVNFTKEDITAVCLQEYTLCELSSQTIDLSLTTIEHPSPATEHPEVMEDEGDSVENVENRTAEIHSQTQSKKKKKFGSTRRPHGGEKREWKDAEFAEEAEHQIIIQDSTSHMLTESQNPVSEVSLDINDSLVTPEEIIQSENEIMTVRIDAPPALFNEGDQIHTEVSNEISDAEGLTDIIEPEEKLLVKDAESVALNEQGLEPIISPKQNSTFRENVFLAVEKHGDESVDDENTSSTCGPVELIPEMQAMSDMQLTKDDITAVVSNKSQNKCEEHLENPTNSESEPEQFLSTSPFVQIQESSSPQVDVTQDNLEFSSLEKKRKIGSTRKRLRGQITGNDQKNKSEAINEQENIQDQNTDQNVTSTVVIEEKSNDSKKEINAGHTVDFTKEDITAVCSQEYTLCELSSQTTDLSLTTIEHPSPATEHPEVMEDEGDSVENVENRTEEIHSQTQRKKKKKFGSTRRPHGGEKREWKDAEITEETEHQIIIQDSTSHMLTESQNPVSEVSLDINDSLVTPEQQEITQTEKEFMTERIDAPPALFNEADQIHTEVSNEISNAGGLTDFIEQDEKMVVNEVKDAESIVLNEQEMTPVFSPIQNDALIQDMFQASSTCSPVELIPETQAMSDIQLTTDDSTVVVSDRNRNKCEDQLENPSNRESGPDQLVITSPFVQIQESKSPQVDVMRENLKLSGSEKKRKIGSTRKSLRGQITGSDQKNKSEAINEQENIQDQNTDQNDTSTGVIEEKSNNSKEEINAGHTENVNKEDFTTVCSQQTTIQQRLPVLETNESESHMQPMEFIPETQARLDMPVLDQHYHTMAAEYRENSKMRESEPEQYEGSSAVHIEELKLDNMAILNTAQTGDSNSGRKRKMGSTRKGLRVMKEKENILDQTREETTPNADKINEKKGTLNLDTEIDPQSIQRLSKPIYAVEPEGDKTGLACKNDEQGQGKQEAWQKCEDTDPGYVGDIDSVFLRSVAIEDRVNPDLNLCGTETRMQIHNELDLSEGSLLSEIEIYLNKNILNTTATNTITNPNVSELSEPMSQKRQIHVEPNPPARRKIGSSRKMPRIKHVEKISIEGRGSEQETINMEKSNVKNSEPKTEAKTDKKTVMAESTEESVELMSEVQAVSQINESTQVTGQPFPEVRENLGSRSTSKGRSGLGEFTHDDYESNQKNTDVQAAKDGIMVSVPDLIKKPESTPISHLASGARPGIDETAKNTVGDTNVSTETGLVSFDNMEKSLPFVVCTGGKPKIDFEQWNEQLPDFEQVIYNVVMVGNSSVGKTSFIKRLQIGQFIPDYSATIGVDTFIQTIQFGNRTVKLYMWDTAGQERYHSITKQVFNKAQGLLLMYDITSAQSFHAIRSWISQVQEKAPPEVILMLLGNKNDCAHREVQLEEGENLAKEYDVHFMECSAATGENVLDSLKTLSWLLVKQSMRTADEYTTLQPKPQNKKSGCC